MAGRLIVNADDFGLCEGVNRAVKQAHTEGILTSATIMAGMPAAAQAVQLAREMPALGVGVHLNLFDASPVSEDKRIKVLLNSNGEFALSLGVGRTDSVGNRQWNKADPPRFTQALPRVSTHLSCNRQPGQAL